MLTEKELNAFLALILKWCTATGCSGRDFGHVFKINPNTACRWLRASRGHATVSRLMHVQVDPIKKSIERMNNHNDLNKDVPYNTLRDLKSHAKRRALVLTLIRDTSPKK